jgi:toxin-antitoxin system PIN domain toxin
MELFDVNVLVYAFRSDMPEHERYKAWLEETLHSGTECGVAELVLAALVRIATHTRIGKQATPLSEVLQFADTLRDHPACLIVAPGPRHWQIFTGLCKAAGVRGALVTDAYFAALAIEHGATWITTDRDYARFPGLRWRHPLDAP